MSNIYSSRKGFEIIKTEFLEILGNIAVHKQEELEDSHHTADQLLLPYIAGNGITEAYGRLKR